MNKRAAGAAVAGVLIGAIIIIAVAFFFFSGNINIPNITSHPNNTASSFTTAASLPASQVVPQGKSGIILFSYLNPFPTPVSATVNLVVGSPSFVSVSNPSNTINMLASMSSAAFVNYSFTCSVASETSTSAFFVSTNNFWQNLTTSVITYPYNISSQQLIPQEVYTAANQGFLSISAEPITIETELTNSQPSAPITIDLAPVVYNGKPFVGSTQGVVSSITISLDNSNGGIASAFVVYNGKETNLTSSSGSSTLSATLSDVNLAFIPAGLTLEITAENSNTPTQNLIHIDTQYNYAYSFSGPQISCQ